MDVKQRSVWAIHVALALGLDASIARSYWRCAMGPKVAAKVHSSDKLIAPCEHRFAQPGRLQPRLLKCPWDFIECRQR